MDPTLLETVAPGIRRLALRTPTLPPATHTNCYLAGTTSLAVFDPASPWDDERQRLAAAVDALPVQDVQLVLTHHHHDHVAGAVSLRTHLQRRGIPVRIRAHPVTADLVAGDIDVDELVEHGEVIRTDGAALEAVLTPGHAPGHLVFLDRRTGAMVAGDMVAGVGTILIDPREGDLGDYLASLVRMQKLDPTVLLPAHGPALEEATAVLGFYAAHRHMRSEQIRAALRTHGAATPDALAPWVYPELPAEAHPVAAVQILAHLRWMVGQGLVEADAGGRYRASG